MFSALLVRFRQNHKTLVRSIPTLTVWVWIPLLPPLQFFRPFDTQQNIFLPKKYKNRLWICIWIHWFSWLSYSKIIRTQNKKSTVSTFYSFVWLRLSDFWSLELSGGQNWLSSDSTEDPRLVQFLGSEKNHTTQNSY